MKCKIYFDNNPRVKNINSSQGEVTLFEKMVHVNNYKNINIDAMIAGEIINGGAYAVYKMYVDGKIVSQGGYEAEGDVFAPNLETSTLIWGKSFCKCCKCIIVKVTAQIVKTTTNELTPTLNFDNMIGSFQGAKGASIRVTGL